MKASWALAAQRTALWRKADRKRSGGRRAAGQGVRVLLLAGVLAAPTARAEGPVVGWGHDVYGQSTPPASVDGSSGRASAIAAARQLMAKLDLAKDTALVYRSKTNLLGIDPDNGLEVVPTSAAILECQESRDGIQNEDPL